MTNVNKLYCVERVGWDRWVGAGDRLVKKKTDAFHYDTEAEAQNRADRFNAENADDGEDDSGDYQAVFYGYATPAC